MLLGYDGFSQLSTPRCGLRRSGPKCTFAHRKLGVTGAFTGKDVAVALAE